MPEIVVANECCKHCYNGRARRFEVVSISNASVVMSLSGKADLSLANYD